jgi:hypothetical protein
MKRIGQDENVESLHRMFSVCSANRLASGRDRQNTHSETAVTLDITPPRSSSKALLNRRVEL